MLGADQRGATAGKVGSAATLRRGAIPGRVKSFGGAVPCVGLTPTRANEPRCLSCGISTIVGFAATRCSLAQAMR